MAIIRLQSKAEFRRHVYYEVDTSPGPIGVGGMGQVFKGLLVDERTGTKRPVAIKFMFDDLPPSAYERARREAAIRLHNDNLIEMIGFLEIRETDITGNIKQHYHVISELLEGVPLSDLLKGKVTDRFGKSIPYAMNLFQQYSNDPENFAKTVVTSVLHGLTALHNAGYIHRDIDPTNIMVTASGHIKLIDLGIAKQMNLLTTGGNRLTVAGKFMGKPEYSAPELAIGDTQNQNQTTDIYSIGILLYQCITGHTPFEGPRHEVFQKQLKEKVPLTVIRNKGLRKVIATACEKKQKRRYQSAAQMRIALEEAFCVMRPHHLTFTVGDTPHVRPHKNSFYAVGAMVILILTIITALLPFNGGREEPLPQAIELRGIAAACAKMKDPATAQQGLAILTEMAENGNDPNAIYLLSRLYFKSRKADDLYPDSVGIMQQALNINIDNRRAHKLLQQTVALSPRNYFALYELGCDYMDGHARTEAVERDLKTAVSYFKKAMQYAAAVADSYYMERIQHKLDVFNEGIDN